MEPTKIPKFGSFKPKSVKDASKNPSTDYAPSKRRETDQTYDDKTLTNRRGLPSHPYGRYEGKHSIPEGFVGARSDSNSKPMRKLKNRPSYSDIHQSDEFLVDRRGDAKNVQYESLSRSDVPHYRRIGNGAVIGAKLRAKIDSDLSTDSKVFMKAHGSSDTKRMTRPLISKRAKQDDSNLKFIISASKSPRNPEKNFIGLERSSKRKRVTNELGCDEAVSFHPDYRSIEGKAEPVEDTDVDALEQSSNSEVDDIYIDLELLAQQENTRLLKLARSDPSNAKLWLELVAHQAQLIHSEHDIVSMTATERSSVSELRLAILDEALKHVPTQHSGRANLLITVMNEGELVWSRSKLESKWKEILLVCPDDTDVYKKYMNSVQCDARNFKFEICRSVLSQGSRLFQHVNKNGLDTSQQLNAVYFLTRLVSLFKDAGYEEQATSIWQAVLEYRFFRPPTSSTVSQDEVFCSFEGFWENDSPKIGEEGSMGWSKQTDSSSSHKRQSCEDTLPPLDSTSLFPSFSEQEICLSSTHILPAPADDDRIQDPYRFVLFKDIMDVLRFPIETLSETSLLSGFLASHGLPLLADSCDGEDFHTYKADPFLTAVSMSNVIDGVKSSEFLAVRQQRQTTLSLFWKSFEPFKLSIETDEDVKSSLVLYLDRSLEALVSVLPNNDALAEYFISWRTCLFPNTARKTAKQLLKTRPNSLRLYNAFALLEIASERIDAARNVWSTALSMRSSLSTKIQEDVILLWHSSILTSLQQGLEGVALASLLGVPDNDFTCVGKSLGAAVTASQQLRTYQWLKNECDRRLIADDAGRAVLYADCIAWLSYLTNDYDISEALQTHRQLKTQFMKESQVISAEILMQYKVTLLKHHLKQGRPFRPKIWMKELSDDLDFFPANSILLDLYTQTASHDRLRNIMHEGQSRDIVTASVTEWIFKISGEVQRMGSDGSGSNMNTVRGVFSRALLHRESAVKHSFELWKLWLNFEYKQMTLASGASRPDAMHHLRQVFLNGLRYLPWHKQWVLLGMRYLGQGESRESEMRQFYETMVERGLRIRVDLEEFL